MFEIELNDIIKSSLKSAKESESRKERCSEIESILDSGCISINAMIEYYDEYWKFRISLKHLLSPLQFKFKTKHVPGSRYSPEFKRELEKLDLRQQESSYQELVKKSNLNGSAYGADTDSLTPSQMAKEIREQITTVFNVLVSVVSVVFAVWYWSGSSTWLPLHYRVILCLFFGILILVAELVVYNSYLRKISDAKEKERAKIEKKKVVKEIVI